MYKCAVLELVVTSPLPTLNMLCLSRDLEDEDLSCFLCACYGVWVEQGVIHSLPAMKLTTTPPHLKSTDHLHKPIAYFTPPLTIPKKEKTLSIKVRVRALLLCLFLKPGCFSCASCIFQLFQRLVYVVASIHPLVACLRDFASHERVELSAT